MFNKDGNEYFVLDKAFYFFSSNVIFLMLHLDCILLPYACKLTRLITVYYGFTSKIRSKESFFYLQHNVFKL